MTADPVLVLAWLIGSHLVADFVLQNDWIAITKAGEGRRGWNGVLVHAAIVALCLVPLPLAYGGPGLALLLLVSVTHIGVDRWKVGATRRAESLARERARRRAQDGEPVAGPGAGLGSAWTPIPGLLYIVDQLAHVGIAIAGWAFLLARAPLEPGWIAAVDSLLGGWDRGAVHAVTLWSVVVGSLVIANTKGAYFFIATLVHPREVILGTEEPPDPEPAPPPPPGYTLRVGPLVATVEPGMGADARAERQARAGRPASGVSAAVPSSPGSPARIGATIGVLERLLVVTFVLVGMEAAIGFVIAAKTLARFKQLDDRGFAEYYLLGTLASVLVALATGLLGAAALDTLP